MNTTTTYVPGVCNINHAEIKRRRSAGYLGLALFIVVFAVLLVLDVNRWFRLVLIVPALLSAIGFLQAKNKFCVGYGAAGLQNSEDGSETAKQVDEASAAIDKRRASSMNRQASLIGVIAGLVAVALPV